MSQGIAVLNYHGVQHAPGEYGWDVGESVYVLPKAAFENQMSALSLLGFQCARIEELVQPAGSEKLFLLTFDDGHSSHYEHVRPVLLDRRFSGVFFVSAGLVGQKHFMTAPQLREMVKAGFEIGSHGYDHVPLPPLSAENLRREVKDSKKKLEDLTGARIRSFSIPRGFYHPRIREAVVEAGYSFLFTSHFGVHPENGDPFYVRRMAVTAATTSPDFEAWVNGRLGIKGCVEEVKELVRRGLGAEGYEKIALLKARLLQRKGSFSV